MTPQTCWTASVAQRSQITRGDAEASWTHDLYATDADKQRISRPRPVPDARGVPDRRPAAVLHPPHAVHQRGEEDLRGLRQRAHAARGSRGAAFPPAEIAAFSDETGSGSVQFEVRSDVENESLGCNDKVDCSIVVIPINGLSCDVPADRRRRPTTPAARAAASSPVPATSPTRVPTRRCPRRCGGPPPTGPTGSRSRSPSACHRTPATCSTRVRRPGSTAPSCSRRPRSSGRRRTA